MAAQRTFDDLVELCAVADAMRPRAVGDVVVDAHGEGIRLLEYHADLAAEAAHVRAGRVDVLPVERDTPLDLHTGDEVVHAVERFEERRLAAAGRADEGRDALFGDVHADIGQRLMAAVPEIQIIDRNDAVHSAFFLLK